MRAQIEVDLKEELDEQLSLKLQVQEVAYLV